MSPRTDATIDLVANLVWPTVVLMFLSERLGAVPALVLGLSAPLAHAAWRRFSEGAASPLSALAIAGVLITGGIGLLGLDARFFALKEAAVPTLVGVVVAATARTRSPLMRTLLWRVLDVPKVEAALKAKDAEAAFDSRLAMSTLGFAALFAVSGLVSAGLAAWMVSSPAGTPAFNEEIGRYNLWSIGLVTVPTMAASVWLFRSVILDLEGRTGLAIDDLLPG